MVKISVGPTGKLFGVHRTILEHRCPWFEYVGNVGDIVEDDWLEAEFATHFEEFQPRPFQIVVAWMYGYQLPAITNKHTLILACEVYFTANGLYMPDLNNDIMDAIRYYHREKTTSLDLLVLAQKAPRGYELRQYIVDQVAYDIHKNRLYGSWTTVAAQLCELRHEVTADLLRSLANYNVRDYPNPSMRDGCCYHHHPSGFSNCGKSKSSLVASQPESSIEEGPGSATTSSHIPREASE